MFKGGRSNASTCPPGSPVGESDNKMNNIFRNYTSHKYIEIHSRMHPIALFHNFLGKACPRIPSNEIEQRYTHRTATQAGCITTPPHYLKTIPMFEHGFLPLIIHSGTPPPPPPR